MLQAYNENTIRRRFKNINVNLNIRFVYNILPSILVKLIYAYLTQLKKEYRPY